MPICDVKKLPTMRIWGRGRADLHLFCDQIGMIKRIEWFNKWKSQFIQRVTIRSNDTIPSSAKLRGPALAPGSQSNEGRTRSRGAGVGNTGIIGIIGIIIYIYIYINYLLLY